MAEFETLLISMTREYAEVSGYREKRGWSEEQLNSYIWDINKYVRSKEINKEILNELKRFFNFSTEYWLFIEDVNCYAYALGIDLPPYCIHKMGFKNPGHYYEAINHTTVDPEKFSIIERMEMDFEALDYDYHLVEPEEEIGEGEWKIAFFNDIALIRGNYHFLRQGQDGLWYHKMGYLSKCIPSNKDDNGNIITNPREACFKTLATKQKMYEYDRCYSLKMR